jgi:hypothetical protein
MVISNIGFSISSIELLDSINRGFFRTPTPKHRELCFLYLEIKNLTELNPTTNSFLQLFEIVTHMATNKPEDWYSRRSSMWTERYAWHTFVRSSEPDFLLPLKLLWESPICTFSENMMLTLFKKYVRPFYKVYCLRINSYVHVISVHTKGKCRIHNMQMSSRLSRPTVPPH